MWANSKKEIEIPPVEVCSILKRIIKFPGIIEGKDVCKTYALLKENKNDIPTIFMGRSLI